MYIQKVYFLSKASMDRKNDYSDQNLFQCIWLEKNMWIYA